MISEVFIPLGFKRKASNWTLENNDLIKIITLQKSSFGHLYSISYGVIIKAIPLDGFTEHIFSGIPEVSDIMTFRRQLTDEVKSYFASLNTEEDVLNRLKNTTDLNPVPRVVKRHFGLE